MRESVMQQSHERDVDRCEHKSTAGRWRLRSVGEKGMDTSTMPAAPEDVPNGHRTEMTTRDGSKEDYD